MDPAHVLRQIVPPLEGASAPLTPGNCALERARARLENDAVLVAQVSFQEVDRIPAFGTLRFRAFSAFLVPRGCERFPLFELMAGGEGIFFFSFDFA